METKKKALKNLEIETYDKIYENILKLNIKQIKEQDTKNQKEINLIESIETIEKEKTKNIDNEINDFIKENNIYLIESEIYSLYNEYGIKNKELKRIKKEKSKIIVKLENNIIISLNKYFKHFGFDFKVKMKNNTSKEKTLTSLEIESHSIEKLSEGEKKILAISYFLTSIEVKLNSMVENNIYKDIVIILDDPFDSNDHTRVDKFKNLPFKFNNDILDLPNMCRKYEKKSSRDVKLIILTHNVGVLYSLISNLRNSDSIKNEDLFIPTFFNEKINVQEWIKKDKDIIQINKISKSFFPIEKNIRGKIWKLNEVLRNFFEKEVEKVDVDVMRTAWYVLTKLSDFNEVLKANDLKKERTIFKSLIQNDSWNQNYEKNKYEVMKEENLIKEFNKLFPGKISIKNQKVQKYFKEVYEKNKEKAEYKAFNDEVIRLMEINDKEDAKILITYSERFVNTINDAVKNNDSNLLSKARHRDYTSSTIVAFGLEEF